MLRTLLFCLLCQSSLFAAGYEIRKVYPHGPKVLDCAGRIAVPTASKAFIYWRSRTPAEIPDSAFATHYLSVHQIEKAAVAESMKLNERKIATSPESEKTNDSLIPPEALKMDIELLSSVLAREKDFRSFQFLIGSFEGTRTQVFVAPPNVSHFEMMSRLGLEENTVKMIGHLQLRPDFEDLKNRKIGEIVFGRRNPWGWRITKEIWIDEAKELVRQAIAEARLENVEVVDD